jgi:O-acetylserine/cysteine efflux transporter
VGNSIVWADKFSTIENFNMSILDIIAAIGVAIIWGLNISIVKICVSEFPPIFITGLRFFIVAMLLIWWSSPPWKQMPLIGILSFVFGALHFGCIFYGLQGVDASIVSILVLMGVPCSIFFARIFLKECFRWKQILGMIIAFIGVLILFDEPSTTSSPLHLTVILLGVVSWGGGNTIIKRIGKINNFALNSWMALFASIQLMTFSFLIENGQISALVNASPRAWGALIFVVIMASVIGYGLWYYLVGKYDIGHVVPFTLLVPIAGVLGGTFIMDENLTTTKVIGGIIILTGVGIIQLRWKRTTKENVVVEPVFPD